MQSTETKMLPYLKTPEKQVLRYFQENLNPLDSKHIDLQKAKKIYFSLSIFYLDEIHSCWITFLYIFASINKTLPSFYH
jgi:hypothetical protein